MSFLQRIFAGRSANLEHISENNTVEERAHRLATISEEEQEAYKWLFEGYSEAWTTETLGLEKRDAKELFGGIYRKLGVTSAREIVRYYAPRELRLIGSPGTDREE